jgi:hypothetical protein
MTEACFDKNREKDFVRAVYSEFQTRKFEFYHLARKIPGYSVGIHQRLRLGKLIATSKVPGAGKARVWHLTELGIALAKKAEKK